jgi:hypothetical protein
MLGQFCFVTFFRLEVKLTLCKRHSKSLSQKLDTLLIRKTSPIFPISLTVFDPNQVPLLKLDNIFKNEAIALISELQKKGRAFYDWSKKQRRHCLLFQPISMLLP